MRRLLRVFTLAMLTALAVAAPRPAAAEHTSGACGFGIPYNNCDDEGALTYMCNYLCPTWEFAICQDETLTCYVIDR